METRITAVETSMKHIQAGLEEIKQEIKGLRSDNRSLIFAGYSGVAFLLVAMSAAYVLLTSKIDDLGSRLSQVQIGIERMMLLPAPASRIDRKQSMSKELARWRLAADHPLSHR